MVDVNDRALRKVTIGLGGPTQGVPREDGFDIVVASEIMAVLCLATDLHDLEERIDRIVVGFTYDRQPVSVAELGVGGAITMLLKEELLPNLVQTLGGTPALVHGGLREHRPRLQLAGRDPPGAVPRGHHRHRGRIRLRPRGGEVLDIKARLGGLSPTPGWWSRRCALKMHGGAARTISPGRMSARPSPAPRTSPATCRTCASSGSGR